MRSATVRNFGANVAFSPRVCYRPQNVADLLDVLNRERGRSIRVGGSLHSWSSAARSDDVYLDLRRLKEVVISHDAQGPLVTVGAGCKIKDLLNKLAAHELTLPAVGLISEQTIAGAISTATHGSGRYCLSHYISAVHLAHYDPVTDAAKVTEIRAGADLRAAKCSLGCLGVIVAVELRPRAGYRIEEHMRMHRRLESVLELEAEHPLQQFYYLPWYDRYLGHHRRETQARRSWLAPLYRAYWFLVMDVGLHVMLKALVQWLRRPWAVRFFYRCIAPLTMVRGWRVVDRSHDMLIMEHELFRHIEIEVFVTRRNLAPALDLARQLILYFDRGHELPAATFVQLEAAGLAAEMAGAPGTYTHHYPLCVRRILPDDTFLSMSSGGNEDIYALSFISYALPDERQGFLRFAEVLAKSMRQLFSACCHWGKVFPHSADDIAALYPELNSFRSVCSKYDPHGRFQNAWVKDSLFEGAAPKPAGTPATKHGFVLPP